MAIPSTVRNTAAGYLVYLKDSINLADKLWTHYAWAVSQGYAAAYKDNQNILSGIKHAIEERQKEEMENMSFFLSLLTVGVAGGVAGMIARKYVVDASGRDLKTAQDVVKKVLELAQKEIDAPLFDALKDHLSPDKGAGRDVFAPAKMSPEEYTSNLFKGITYNIALLTQIVYEAQYDPNLNNVNYEGTNIRLRSGGELSAVGAKLLTETILATSANARRKFRLSS